MQMSDFKSRLKKLMNDARVNARQLALTIGISPPTIQRYLTGEIEPKASQAVKLAQALDTTVDYLLTGREPEPAGPAELRTGKGTPYALAPMCQSAAGGSARYEEIEDEGVVVLKKALGGVKTARLKAFRVIGKSMEPEIRDGDIIVCEEDPDALSRLRDNAYYCVWDQEEGGVTVKRVIYDKENRQLILTPLNPEFPVQRIRLKRGERAVVLGRVLGIAWRKI